jgi:hypothetical protein
MLTPASLHYLRHLAGNAGILLLLVAFILFQATAPRYGPPALKSAQARKAWALYAALVLLAALVVWGLWLLG